MVITFAQVMITAISSFKGSLGMNQVPVNVAAHGDMLKLAFPDSNEYAGLVVSSALSTLLTDWRIQLGVTLTAPYDNQDKGSKKAKSRESHLPQECPVRIVVYGCESQRVGVGNILSDAGLYLQHPLPSEYDRTVQYINPHYLLRPGCQMPDLEHLAIDSDSGVQKSSAPLDEANKSRFMHIFDLANVVEESSAIEPSPRLRSPLHE